MKKKKLPPGFLRRCCSKKVYAWQGLSLYLEIFEF